MTEPTKLHVWQVEATEPHPDYPGKGRRNLNIHVYAQTLEEVIPAVRAKYPDCTFIKIIGDRWANDTIIVEAQ